jgi:hypothetical protein
MYVDCGIIILVLWFSWHYNSEVIYCFQSHFVYSLNIVSLHMFICITIVNMKFYLVISFSMYMHI